MRLTLILIVIILSGCANAPSKPDLARLFAVQSKTDVDIPVVVVHGVMGGRLFSSRTENEIWPGSLRRLLFDDYKALRLDIDQLNEVVIDSDLYVKGITDRAAGQDFYGRIITVLQEAGQYRLRHIGDAPEESTRSLYVFAYDWRQDNVDSARQLDQFIQQIRKDHDNAELKVDIVAHSMGGLITRYYARYGTADVLNSNNLEVNYTGAQNLRRVILLGTPNFGSVLAADVLNTGRKVGFGTIAPEILATFPSTYQLLPHALNDWLLTTDGSTNDADMFEVEFWRDAKLSIYNPAIKKRIIESNGTAQEGEAFFERFDQFFERNLEQARRFTWSLTVPLEEVMLEYVVLGGDCTLTPARMVLERDQGHDYLRASPGEIKNKVAGVDYELLMKVPGDGTVTKASLLARQTIDPTVARHRYSFFPLGYAFFLCEDHQSLTGNISFQDNLLHALLSADPL